MSPEDHIEDYIHGRLSASDATSFEQAMQSDDALRELVENYESLQHLSEGMLEVELFQQVQEVARTRKENNPDYAAGNHILFYLGAAVVIALFSWYFYHNPIETTYDDKEPTEQPIAAAYQPPIWPITKSGAATTIQRAVSSYLDGDFDQAQSQLLAIEGDDRVEARYWLAEMLVERGDFQSAKTYLPTAEELPRKATRINYLRRFIENK